MRSSKSIMTGVAVLAALALPMVAGAANKLVVTQGTTDTPAMVVTDTGFIGIGKTPSATIDIVGAPFDARTIIQTVGTSVYGGGSFMGLHNNTYTDNGGLPRKDDRIGFFLFGSKTGASVSAPSGLTPVTGGGVQVYAEQTWNATSYPTYFTFETAPVGSATKSERMRVTSSGNIGIGTTAPTQKLEVNGGVRLATYTTKPTCDTNARGTLWSTRVGSGDTLEICVYTGTTYAWKLITLQ